MSMNNSQLGSEINSKLNTLSEAEKRDATLVWVKIAEAIIDHIKNNAEIASLTQSGISVSPPSAVITQGQTVQAQGVIT